MQVDDEVSHLRIVDGFAGFPEPGPVGLGVVRIKAHDVEFGQILELDILDVLQLAAKYHVEELFRHAAFKTWAMAA